MQLYLIRFPPHLSEKIYVGISSKSAKQRFKEHCASSKKYPIVLALRKYGSENAILEVLAECGTWAELYALEQDTILLLKSKAPNGYNLTDGGPGTFGLPASAERRRKISEANTGRKASKETCAKISAANKLRDHSKQVEAMRKANIGRKRSASCAEKLKDVWVGRKHSLAARKKMSDAAKRRDNTARVEAMRKANTGRKIPADTIAKRLATIARKKCTSPL